VIWLDALDLPLVYYLEASYCVEGEPQLPAPPVPAELRYRRGGLLPYEALDAARRPYPLLRFAWSQVRQSLVELGAALPADALVHLAYVNPETGRECLPTLGFSALMLRPGEERNLGRRSASAVLHVVEGRGEAGIDGTVHSFEEADTMSVPTHAGVRLRNGSTSKPTFLFVVDDAPLQRKLGIYERPA
jgi:gentisate 1,2-dioxygenase